MKKSNKYSDAWFETSLIILDKEVVNYFVAHEGSMTTDVKSHVDDTDRHGDGVVSHSNMMDVDDNRYNIGRIRYNSQKQSKYFQK
eukprot:13364582-Ditylum_brightwellii.AAC.1